MLGERRPEVIHNLTIIGTLYIQLGSYPQTLECFQRAYELFKKEFGDDHPDTKALEEKLNNI